MLGDCIDQEPPPFEIDQKGLVEYFRMGMRNFGGVWKNIIDERDYQVIDKLARKGKNNGFSMPSETWVRIVFRYAAAFHATPRQRFKLLDTMIPLYYGRVASLVNELKDLDREQAEALIDRQAELFESMKGELVSIWRERKSGEE